jgi:cytochrome P450
MMHFGLGRHACPGRFLAGYEIKLVLATLLTQYDFKFKENAPRPVPMQHELSNSPDPRVELLFKRRSVGY